MDENRKYNITIETIMSVISIVGPSDIQAIKLTLEEILYDENSKYFMSIERAANKFNVSPIDIMTWIHTDILEGYRLPTGQFVVPTYTKPKDIS